jgi:hypothetical protein
MDYNLFVRIWVILLALICAFYVYQLYVKQKVLKPLCFIDTNSSLQIEYRKYGNSVLVHMIPTGFWVWFDGNEIFIYGEPTGRMCTDEGYEAVYVYDVSTQKVIGYQCAYNIDKVQEFYDQKNVPVEYIFERNFDRDFDVYDLINYLADKRIISLS